MGSKYKKELERTWEGKTMSDVKIKTLQKQANENLSNIANNKNIVFRKRGCK